MKSQYTAFVLPPRRNFGWSFKTAAEARAWIKKHVGAKYRKQFRVITAVPATI